MMQYIEFTIITAGGDMVAVSGFEVAWFAGHYSFVGWVTKEQPKIFLTAVQAYLS